MIATHNNRTHLVAYLVIFVAGYFSAVMVSLLQQGNPRAEDWVLLAPFLLAMTIFSIAVVLFALQARLDLRGVGEKTRVEADKLLRDARTAFDSKLKESCDGLRDGIDSITKESTVVYENDFESYATESHCYTKLDELIANAKRSIFVIPNPYREGEIDTWELPPRMGYLKTIESKVLQMQADPDFEYMRIQQVPKHCTNLKAHIGQSAAEHIRRLSELSQPMGKVQFRIIDQDQISGQLIIDETILVKFLCGIDQRGNKRLFGITIMRDPSSSDIVGYYQRLRTNLLGNSSMLDVDMLK